MNAATTLQGTNAIAIGIQSGQGTQSSGAIAIGYQAGQTIQGINAIAIGTQSGQGTQSSGAIAIGYQAGDAITTGNKNIIIGYNVDAPVDTGSGQLNIANLIFATGSFGESKNVTVNGKVGINTNTPQYALQVSGSIAPVGDNKFPLGNPSNRFSDVFAAQSTIGGLFETGLRTTDLGLCETGTIVSWKVDKCVPCEVEEDELVMGVVKRGKDEPLILGAEPILVTGKVEVGDYIVTSNKKGHGKAVKRGTLFKKDLFGKVIAQALESGVGESYAIKAMIRKM